MAGRRCEWANEPAVMRVYHDTEWGTPLHDDRKLFEFLILDGMQAGLSWLTILKKRESFRNAFDRFDARKIARYDQAKIRALLRDPGIIRNRLKVHAAVANARAFLRLKEEQGSLHEFLWGFVQHRPVQNRWRQWKEIPSISPASEAMSKALLERGFTFVGPTICYAFMQAAGMVNDHLITCFRSPQRRGRRGASLIH